MTHQRTYPGSCHCGAVRFEATLDADAKFSRCNCSICTKLGQLGTIAKPSALVVKSGEYTLSSYEWASKTSKRYFCPACGVFVFARGHLDVLGGDYVSINANALDGFDPSTVPVIYWDGRHNNWQAGPRDRPWPLAEAQRAG